MLLAKLEDARGNGRRVTLAILRNHELCAGVWGVRINTHAVDGISSILDVVNLERSQLQPRQLVSSCSLCQKYPDVC
jgi:hypothetical protein